VFIACRANPRECARIRVWLSGCRGV